MVESRFFGMLLPRFNTLSVCPEKNIARLRVWYMILPS